MVWHFHLQASNFQSQLSIILTAVFFQWQHFYRPDFLFFCFFRNLPKWQVLDSGNKTKGGRIFFFFWRPFLNFFRSCDKIIFLFIFFPCSIAKNLVVLQAFPTLEAPPLAPLFYFGKTHFYSMFLKSTLPIFNVSRLGQLSDLFLLLFFPLTIVEILMWCSACCSLLQFCDFFGHCSILRHGVGQNLQRRGSL